MCRKMGAFRPVMNTMEYNERVREGKRGEAIIIRKLRELGYRIREPSPTDDIFEKIDGYIVNKTSTEEPVQIKYRQTGIDLLMETCFLTYPSGDEIPCEKIVMNGRDVKGTAKVFICVEKDRRTIRFCDYSSMKKEAVRMTNHLLSMRKKNQTKTLYRETTIGQVRVSQDKCSKRSKIIFFCKPDTFCLRTHKLSSPLEI